MNSSLQHRARFVWLRFFVLVMVAVLPVALVAVCMLTCWIIRMISRLSNWLLSKPSIWLWNLVEQFATVLGFTESQPQSNGPEIPAPQSPEEPIL